MTLLSLGVRAETVTEPLRQFGIGTMYKTAWAPDEQLFATCGQRGGVFLWDAATGARMRSFTGHSDIVRTVAFSPDGKWLLTGGIDKSLRLWDAATGEQVRTFTGHTDVVVTATFSPDGQRILSGSLDKTAAVWDTASGDRITTLTGHTAYVVAAAFSPDGSKALTASYDKSARIWDLATGKALLTLSGHTDVVMAAAFSPDGKLVATGANDSSIRIWNAESGAPVRTIALPHTTYIAYVTSTKFSRDGATIYAGVCQETHIDDPIDLLTQRVFVRSWDVATGNPGLMLSGYWNDIHSLHLSSDGQRLMTGSLDGKVNTWNAKSGALMESRKMHNYFIAEALFSPDGKRILTSENDGSVYLWDARSGAQLLAITGLPSWPFTFERTRIAFSPSGERFLTSSNDRLIRIWETKTGAPVTCIAPDGFATPAPYPWYYAAVFGTSDGQLVSDGQDGIKLWDLNTGNALKTLGTGYPNQIALSRDGARMIVNEGQRFKIWNAQTGALLKECGTPNYTNNIAMLPDGKKFVTVERYNTRLRDAVTGSEIRTFPRATGCDGYCAASSPDGSLILTGGNRNASWGQPAAPSYKCEAWLEDAATGANVRSYAGNPGILWAVAFSPDGATLLTAGTDGMALLWKTDPSRNAVRAWESFE